MVQKKNLQYWTASQTGFEDISIGALNKNTISFTHSCNMQHSHCSVSEAWSIHSWSIIIILQTIVYIQNL